jgi:hypothetical protein
MAKNFNLLEDFTGGSAMDFKEMIYNRLSDLVEEALNERKKHVAAIYFSEKIDDQEEDLQVLKQGEDEEDDAEDKKKSKD